MISRYQHLTNSQFEEVSAALTITRRKEIATEYELRLHTGRIMRYQVMSCHDILVKYHKPDMAMIGNIKIIYISVFDRPLISI